MNTTNGARGYETFYEEEYHRKVTVGGGRPEEHPFYSTLTRFIADFGLTGKKVLEIGSGTGLFQDVVPDYTGLDITESLRKHYHKPFYTTAVGARYPFADGTFDGFWSYAAFEHIPDIENALEESLRVLKVGGVFLFHPAWNVRSWASEGYVVRPYRDLSLSVKLKKFSLLWRKQPVFRAVPLLVKRIWWVVRWRMGRGARLPLTYKRLTPNYEKFWDVDSDACNSIDPYAVILWFKSRGCEVMNYPTPLKQFFVRTGPLVIKKVR